MRALATLALLLMSSPQPAPPGARKDAIRAVKLDALFNAAPGKPGTVQYADLNGDGIEDAVIPLLGEHGAVAIAVYGYDEVGLLRPMLLHEGQGLQFSIEAGKLVITERAVSAGKAGVTVMTYAWNGRALVLVDRRAAPEK